MLTQKYVLNVILQRYNERKDVTMMKCVSAL